MPYRIQSVERAFRIMEEMVGAAEGLTRRELAEATGINSNSVFRFLAVLGDLGFVQEETQERTHVYRLTPRIFEWGERWARQFRLPELARPHLARLARATGETVNLGIRSGDAVTYMVREDGAQAIALTVRTGGRVPLHATALGKIFLAEESEDEVRELAERVGLGPFTDRTVTDVEPLLAELAAVRREGVAHDQEELRQGVVCVAAGVRDASGRLVGAISCSLPRVRGREVRRQELAVTVQETARAISQEMGWQGLTRVPRAAQASS